MAGVTNKGKYRMAGALFRGETLPASYYVALITDAAVPDEDFNLFSQITEVAAGNGYTLGGIQLSKNSTDFDTWTEDDSGNLGKVLIRDVVWTASGGTLPASGDGARYAIMTDANSTVEDREIWCYWDLASDRIVSDSQTLTLSDLEIRFTET